MDLNFNTWLNLGQYTNVIIIFVVALLTIVSLLVFIVLRPRFGITVNCWFCGEDSHVAYTDRNCFHCPNCGQYNGFNEDGDYNRPIPAQYSDVLNDQPMGCERTEFVSPVTMCDRCCRNETLKIKQISAFVPLNEATYDEEMAVYKRHLDTVYRLCATCQVRVRDRILMQDQRLSLQLASLQRYRENLEEDTQPDPGLHDSISSESTHFPHKHVVTLLHTLISACTLGVVFATAVSLLDDAELYRLPSPGLFSSVARRLRLETRLLCAGALGVKLLAIYLLTAHRTYRLDIFNSLLSLAQLLSTYAPAVELTTRLCAVLPLGAVTCGYIPCVAVTLNYFCSLAALFVNRRDRGRSNISIRRLSLDSDRLNDSRREQDVDEHNASFRSAFTSRTSVRSSPSATSNVPHPKQVRVNQGLDLELDSISLGAPLASRSKSGVFGSSFSLPGDLTGNTRRHQPVLQMPRPLISPAKFSVPTPFKLSSAHSHRDDDSISLWSVSKTAHALYQKSHPKVTNQRGNRGVDLQPRRSYRSHKLAGYSDEESDQSQCPVDSTTAQEPDNQATRNHGDWWNKPGLIIAVLAFSVSTNIVLVALSILKS